MASMQFSRRWSSNDCLDEVYVPFFGALGAAWDDPIIASWSANPLACSGRERSVVTSGGGMGPPAIVQHPVVIIAGQGAEAIHRADCCGGIREWCSAMS